MIDGRECFEPNMVPITEFRKGPPTYIQCDCNKVIGRSQGGNGSYYRKYEECGKVFSMKFGNIVWMGFKI